VPALPLPACVRACVPFCVVADVLLCIEQPSERNRQHPPPQSPPPPPLLFPAARVLHVLRQMHASLLFWAGVFAHPCGLSFEINCLRFVGLCCVLCVVLFVCREAAIAAISQKVHLGVREERRTHLQRTSFWIPEVAPSAGPSAIPKVSVCVYVCVCFAFCALCM